MGLLVLLLFITAGFLVEGFPTIYDQRIEPDDAEFFSKSATEHLTTDDRNSIRMFGAGLGGLGVKKHELLSSKLQDDMKDGMDKTELLFKIINAFLTDEDRRLIRNFCTELLTRLAEKSNKPARLRLIDIAEAIPIDLGFALDKLELLFKTVDELLTDDDKKFIHNLYTEFVNRLEKQATQIESILIQKKVENTMSTIEI